MKSTTIKQLDFSTNLSLGFEIISIDNNYAQSKKNLRSPHRASFYAIIWFQKGNPVHTVDFEKISVKADSFLFIRKNAVQFFEQSKSFKSKVLIFTDVFFSKVNQDHLPLQNSPLFNDFGGPGDNLNISATDLLKDIWTLMETESAQKHDSFQPQLLQNYLSNFILLASLELQQSGYQLLSKGRQFDILINFKNQLEKDYKREKSVRYYGKSLFISEKVLTKATLETMGKTPKQLVEERIMLEAKRLLAHSNNSMKTIGLILGFDEPTNFNKFFKKYSGNTPAAFRATYKSIL